MYNTPTKIESTAKIVVPEVFDSTVCSEDPYFKTPAKWVIVNRSAPYSSVANGSIIFNSGDGTPSGGNYLNQAFATLFPNVVNVGFIIEAEGIESFNGGMSIFAGSGSAVDAAQICYIPKSGRYTGIIPRAGTLFGFSSAMLTAVLGSCTLKELFFFNADKYKYTDFLEDPVSGLICTQSPAVDYRSSGPKLGLTDSIPTTGSWRQGDRVENNAWDGKFSTAIAWVCTVGGTPGTWSPVYTYDWYNSAPDPYFVSYIIGGKWQTNIGAGTGTVSVGNGILNATAGTSPWAGLGHTTKCIVSYELVTVEYTATVVTGLCAIRLAQGGVDIVPTVGSFQVDKTVQVAAGVSIVEAFANAGGAVLTLTKLNVRPKYPFLTKAPSSFAALPTVKQYLATDGSLDAWYSDNIYVTTYLAGVITFPAQYALLWQKVNLVAGKTYRIRVNFTVNPATSAFIIVIGTDAFTGTAVATITNDGIIGIKEVTFVAPAVSTKIMVQCQTVLAGQKIDYIRLYSE